MQYFSKESLKVTAIALLLALVSWGIGLRIFAPTAQASFANVTDTLSSSIPGAGVTHTIQWTDTSTSTTPQSGQTIQITFDPTTSAFGNIGAVTSSSLSLTGLNLVAACSAGLNNVTFSTSTTAITFLVCSSGVSSGTKQVVINNVITNPTSTGSYIIRIAGTEPNSADTRVAIVNSVAMTASIDTTFTFTVTGLATDTSIGYATTTGTASSTAFAFGTLQAGAANAKILGQELSVTTNARNGYTVTVQQDQNMFSANGATINVFRDNNATSTPSPWVSPSGVLNATNTYAHYGFTSDSQEASDTTGMFNATGTSQQLYVGNISSPVQIMTHTQPTDGVATSSGRAQVGVKIEISPLEPAGNDYHNTLWYVATPSF